MVRCSTTFVPTLDGPTKVLESVLELTIEIAREGREGRRVGTLFTVGFADVVMRQSRPLILDPLAMHPSDARQITDPNLRGTIKELAQLDGVFIVDGNGVVVAACRYLDASSKDVVCRSASEASISLPPQSPKNQMRSRSWFPRVRWCGSSMRDISRQKFCQSCGC